MSQCLLSAPLPQCPSVSVPLCLSAPLPQCPSASVPLCLCAPLPQCPSASVPLCLSAPLHQCPSFSVPLCLSALLSQCPSFSVPLCLSAPLLQCPLTPCPSGAVHHIICREDYDRLERADNPGWCSIAPNFNLLSVGKTTTVGRGLATLAGAGTAFYNSSSNLRLENYI